MVHFQRQRQGFQGHGQRLQVGIPGKVRRQAQQGGNSTAKNGLKTRLIFLLTILSKGTIFVLQSQSSFNRPKNLIENPVE